MNQWNNGSYGNNYKYREESAWLPLGIILGIILVPLGLYWGIKLLNYLLDKYTGGQIVVYSILGTLIFFTLSSIVWAVGNEILRWWDDLFYGIGNTAAQNTYNSTNNTNNTTYLAPKPKKSYIGRWGAKTDGLLAGEKKKPPRAEFFGRLNGSPVSSQGKYVERYLNQYEYGYWLKQKERDDALKAGLLDESLERSTILAQTTTKISY